MSSKGAFIWVEPGVRFNVKGILISQPPTGGTSGSSVTNGGPAFAVPIRTNQHAIKTSPKMILTECNEPNGGGPNLQSRLNAQSPSERWDGDCALSQTVPISSIGVLGR